MNTFSRDLMRSMAEAAEFAEGTKSAARVHVVDVPDVRAIRQRLHMSQQRFAETYRIPLPTLKNWEQGRRAPDAPAAAYLQAISRQPKGYQGRAAAWIKGCWPMLLPRAFREMVQKRIAPNPAFGGVAPSRLDRRRSG
jgi:putative transcriptional regulator